MHLETIALMLALASPPERLPQVADHTPPQSWSSEGWQQLRWGMGLGDVSRVFKESSGAFRAAHDFKCEQSIHVGYADCTLDETAFEAFSQKPTFNVAFHKGRLWSVTLFFPREKDFAAHRHRYGGLLRLLREKYGRMNVHPRGYVFPLGFQPKASVAILTWETARTEIQLTFVTGEEGRYDLSYTDLRAAEILNRYGRARDLAPERDKF